MEGIHSRVSPRFPRLLSVLFADESVDADEMWTQTISSLHHALRPAGSSKSFVDQYLSADLQQT
jgi:hypothetical protein